MNCVKFFTLICLAILAASHIGLANADNVTELPASNLDQNAAYSLGGTFDRASKYRADRPSCLANSVMPASNYDISNATGVVKFAQNQLATSKEKTVTTEVTEDYLWGLYSETYSYTTTTRNDEYTLVITYTYDFAGLSLLRGDLNNLSSKLNPEARAIYDKFDTESTRENYDKFRQMCGTDVITALDAGAKLNFSLIFHFTSATEREGAAKIIGNNNFTTIIKTIELDKKLKESNSNSMRQSVGSLNGAKISYSLSAVAIQYGGTPEKLGEVFGKYESKDSKVQKNGNMFSLKCKSGTVEGADCINLITSIIGYSSEIGTQIRKGDGYDKTKLYYYNPRVTPYFKDRTLANQPPPNENGKKALWNLYSKDEKTALFISRYLAYLKKVDMNGVSAGAYETANLDKLIEQLELISHGYKAVMNMYKTPELKAKIRACYTNIQEKCDEASNDITQRRANILGDEEKVRAAAGLINYLKQSHYQGSFYVRPGASVTSCNVMPISMSEQGIFLVDCPKRTEQVPKFTMEILRLSNGHSLNIKPFSYQVSYPAKSDGKADSYKISYSDYKDADGVLLEADGLIRYLPDYFDYNATDNIYEGSMDVTITSSSKPVFQLQDKDFNLSRIKD